MAFKAFSRSVASRNRPENIVLDCPSAIVLVVILVAGARWPRLAAAGVLVPALGWAFAEFWFGFNQECLNGAGLAGRAYL